MDANGFDALARVLGATGSRRAAARALAVALAAAWPSGRRASAGCSGDHRRLGEACDQRCRCAGDLRCGQPRPEDERALCGQNASNRRVCCKGQGERCGDDCECCGSSVCQAGRCVSAACDPACATGQRCLRGVCVCDSTSCPDGCCDDDTCRPGQNDGACGKQGAACAPCASPETCGGGGTPGACGCEADDKAVCAGKCGTATNRCGDTVDCGALCAGCCDGATCKPGTSDGACGTGGKACAPCDAPASCAGGVFIPAAACSGSGVCVVGDSVNCDPYACDQAGERCLTSCDRDGDCADDAFCNDRACVGDRPNGESCDRNAQCRSGSCSNSVCCSPGRKGCNGACIPDGDCCTAADCTAGGAHTVSTCTDGVCSYLCDAGYHQCDGRCVADTDATACGSTCVDCTKTTPANAVAACTGGACTYPCDTGAGATECGSVCCAAGKRCTNATAGTCCTPSCTNRVCGSDGCDSVCPPGCGTNQTCVESSGTCCTNLLATCSGSGQSSCCQTDGTAVCEAYAQCGTVSAGQRCCRLPGGTCRGNCDCCGDSTCLNGSCSGCTENSQCSSNVCCSHGCCAAGQSCQNGECTSPPEVCKAKLEICVVDAQHPAPSGNCCQTSGALACQSYAACGTIPGGSTRCCVPDNGTCTQLCDCCGSSRCFNGVCHPSPGQYSDSRCPTGTTLLGTCTSSSQCCQYGEASGSVVCAAYGAGCVVAAGQRCCRPSGKPCTDTCDCCGDLSCNSGTCG